MLTPEERQRIYLEEKARLDARIEELRTKKSKAGPIIGGIAIGVIVLVVALASIGSYMEKDVAKASAMTPGQQRAETLRSCASLRASWAFKTYSELTEQQRRVLFSCTLLERQ